MKPLTFKEYQTIAESTAIYPPKDGRQYTTLGLAAEAGEVAGIWAKIVRDKNGKITDEDIDKIEKELGDILWFVTMVAKEFHLDLEGIAKTNNEKLLSRLKRGKLRGSGDDR